LYSCLPDIVLTLKDQREYSSATVCVCVCVCVHERERERERDIYQ
jgi:hypothetical protein